MVASDSPTVRYHVTSVQLHKNESYARDAK